MKGILKFFGVGIMAIIGSFSLFAFETLIVLSNNSSSFSLFENIYWRYGIQLLGIVIFLISWFIKSNDEKWWPKMLTIGLLYLLLFFIQYLFEWEKPIEVSKVIKSYCLPQNYDIKKKYNSIYVIMPCPTIGIVGRNEIGFDGFTYKEVEKDLFKMVRSSSEGNYKIFVILKYKDSYGNYSESDTTYVSTLNRDDLRKYADYSYFAGKSAIADAFPWNRFAIKKVRVDHNVIRNNNKGMVIHVQFETPTSKISTNGFCTARFYYSNNDKEMISTNKGILSCKRSFTCDTSQYDDFQLFMPYENIYMKGKGSIDCYFCIELQIDDKIKKSKKTYFTFSRN